MKLHSFINKIFTQLEYFIPSPYGENILDLLFNTYYNSFNSLPQLIILSGFDANIPRVIQMLEWKLHKIVLLRNKSWVIGFLFPLSIPTIQIGLYYFFFSMASFWKVERFIYVVCQIVKSINQLNAKPKPTYRISIHSPFVT